MLTPAESKAQRLYALALVFYFVSFIGWCGETLLFLVRFGRLRDRGFLTLPFCTIYGSCLTGMYLFIARRRTEGSRRSSQRRRACAVRRAPPQNADCMRCISSARRCSPPLRNSAFGGLFSAFGVRLWDYGYKKVHLYGADQPRPVFAVGRAHHPRHALCVGAAPCGDAPAAARAENGGDRPYGADLGRLSLLRGVSPHHGQAADAFLNVYRFLFSERRMDPKKPP